jgi:hypothetical protein
MRTSWRLVWLSGVALRGLTGCGDDPAVVTPNDPDPGTPLGGNGAGTGGSFAATGGTPPIGVGGRGSQTGGRGSAGGGSTDPCDDLECGEGQRCESENMEAECVDNECDDLDCADLEECVPATGGGNDCPVTRYCDTEKCVDDVCEPDTRRCDGNQVFVCASNGGEDSEAYACDSAGYFESECNDAAGAPVGCTCEDDWDCPEHTTCETGACSGTGFAPPCTLPPPPFEDVLPQLEFRWGGSRQRARLPRAAVHLARPVRSRQRRRQRHGARDSRRRREQG